jgi:hypothetical protein
MRRYQRVLGYRWEGVHHTWQGIVRITVITPQGLDHCISSSTHPDDKTHEQLSSDTNWWTVGSAKYFMIELLLLMYTGFKAQLMCGNNTQSLNSQVQYTVRDSDTHDILLSIIDTE